MLPALPLVARVAPEDALGEVPGDELAVGEPSVGLLAPPGDADLAPPVAAGAARCDWSEGATAAPAGDPVGMAVGTAVGATVEAVDGVGLVARTGRNPINEIASTVQKPASLSLRTQARETNVDILPSKLQPRP